MKSDEQLQSEIQAEINADSKIGEAGQIGVAVHHGVATLTGQVEMPSCKWEAERAAWRVEGVRAVAEEIEVKPTVAAPTDGEIADAVANILEWSSELDSKDVHARVEGGWVTLEGSVPRPAERRAAERLAGQIRGVKGVSNRIRIAAPASEPMLPEPGKPEEAEWRPVDQEC
jgi:osmotically-inducible protein OsmY